jgi:hypothetical protein
MPEGLLVTRCPSQYIDAMAVPVFSRCRRRRADERIVEEEVPVEAGWQT